MSPRTKSAGNVTLEKMPSPSELVKSDKKVSPARRKSPRKAPQLEKLDAPDSMKTTRVTAKKTSELEKMEPPTSSTRKRSRSHVGGSDTGSQLKKMQLPEKSTTSLEQFKTTEINTSEQHALYRKVLNSLEMIKQDISGYATPEFTELTQKIEEMTDLIEDKNIGESIDLTKLDVEEMADYNGMVASVYITSTDENEPNQNEVNSVFLEVVEDEYVPGAGYHSDDEVLVSLLIENKGNWEPKTIPVGELSWLYVFPERGTADVFVTW